MKWIVSAAGKLRTQTHRPADASNPGRWTGLDAWDALWPATGLATGAIHELLTPAGIAPPLFVATLLARSVVQAPDPTLHLVESTDADHPTPDDLIHTAGWIDRDTRSIQPPGREVRGFKSPERDEHTPDTPGRDRRIDNPPRHDVRIDRPTVGGSRTLVGDRTGSPGDNAPTLAHGFPQIIADVPHTPDRFASRSVNDFSPGMVESDGAVVWSDPDRTLYPPAVFARGISPRGLYLLHAPADQQIWAVAEALRCPGVSAVVAPVQRLTRLQARRLRLSAEQGGGIGILLRPDDARSGVYAASSRWRVTPLPGDRTVQRWEIRLVHGQGGLTGKSFVLEFDRETNHVRSVDRLSDRPASQTPGRATA